MYSAGAYAAVYEQRGVPRVETEGARELGGRIQTVIEALVLAHVRPERAKPGIRTCPPCVWPARTRSAPCLRPSGVVDGQCVRNMMKSFLSTPSNAASVSAR